VNDRLSDGLIGDLRHLRERSRVGATVEVDAVAQSDVLATQPPAVRRLCALAGGDDYELLFTAPAQRRDAVAAAARGVGAAVSRIGRIDAEPGLRLIDAGGQRIIDTFSGFDHFRS
jgi:thiamine-monophosphate kinase